MEVHPLKEWLRQNPGVVPLDPSSTTSHQLRSALRRLGWTMQETPSEIRLLKPGTHVSPEVVDQVLGPNDLDSEASDDAWFTLEYQLRDFLASNLTTIPINGRRLRLFLDSAGRDGIEFPTGVGPIDILAVDDSGSFFVFELKRANSPDKALGQLARYMGWVAQTIGKGHEVFGVIVATICATPFPLCQMSPYMSTKCRFAFNRPMRLDRDSMVISSDGHLHPDLLRPEKSLGFFDPPSRGGWNGARRTSQH